MYAPFFFFLFFSVLFIDFFSNSHLQAAFLDSKFYLSLYIYKSRFLKQASFNLTLPLLLISLLKGLTLMLRSTGLLHMGLLAPIINLEGLIKSIDQHVIYAWWDADLERKKKKKKGWCLSQTKTWRIAANNREYCII